MANEELRPIIVKRIKKSLAGIMAEHGKLPMLTLLPR